MQGIDRYSTLYDKLLEMDGDIGKPIEVSLELLAETWFCTVRNVKLIIRKLEEEGWIAWQAGRGRGHLSRITLLVEKDMLVLEHAQLHVTKGEYKQAFELLDAYREDTQVKRLFINWLNNQFGHHKETWLGMSEADVLRFPVYHPLITLDTAELVYAFDSHMVRQIFSTLVQFDHVRNAIIPCIAHTWEHNEDATIWTFYLRKGVLFHHGRELTAEDVIFTIERLRCNRTQSWMVRTIESIEQLGNYAIRIQLSMSNWLFLRLLCSTTLSVVPCDWGGMSEEAYWRKPSGTGPFQMVEWSESQCVLQAHHAHFQGRPHLDIVIIAFMPIASAPYVQDASWPRLMYGSDYRGTMSDVEWKRIEWLSRGCNLLHWNLRKEGPQRSLAFRQAVNVLLDRHRMIEELGEDRVYPARGFYPKESTPYEEDVYDPEYGQDLLQVAGYDGTPIKLISNAKHEKDVLWIQSCLRQYGIQVMVEIDDWMAVREPEQIAAADGIINGLILAEEEVCLLEMFEQQGNFVKACMSSKMNRWIQKKIDKALSCQKPHERWACLESIERRIIEESSILFLLHKKFNTQFHHSVRGVGINSLGWIDFKYVWVAPQSTG